MSTINPVSFNGKLVSTTHYIKDNNYSIRIKESNLRKHQITESYDKNIKKIEAYKQFALKFDDMMYNDSDIQKSISELPKDFKIIINDKCEFADEYKDESEFSRKYDNDTINLISPTLVADESMILNTPKGRRMDLLDRCLTTGLNIDYNEKGPNKQEVMNWLDNLKTFFN